MNIVRRRGKKRTMALSRGQQHGVRGHQVARADHVGHPRACSDNSINIISVFTLMNIPNFY